MSDLLPCPFCGGEAKLEEWHKSNYVTENGHKCPECWFIGCQAGMECPGYSRALHKTKEQAIAWWSPRADLPYKHLDAKNPCRLHGPVFMKSDCDVCRKAKDAYRSQNLLREGGKLENARMREVIDHATKT